MFFSRWVLTGIILNDLKCVVDIDWDWGLTRDDESSVFIIGVFHFHFCRDGGGYCQIWAAVILSSNMVLLVAQKHS